MKRIGFAVIGAAVGAVAIASQAAQAAEVKLKAASFLPARAAVAKPFIRWTEEVNKRCDGKVEITVVGPEAIGSLEQWNALKNGVVDMHYGPANYYKGAMHEAVVTDLAENSLVEQRKNGAIDMLDEVYNKKMNAHFLTYLLNGVHFYVWTRKEAKDVPLGEGKFDGFRLRSVPIYDEFFKWLGASPVRMSPPDVFTGLERGTVDGYGWPDWGVTDFGWEKYTKYRYGPGFLNAAVSILVNLDKWKGMADDQRKCLQDAALWVEKEWPSWREAGRTEEAKALKKAGVEFVDLGEKFADKAHELYWADLEKANPEFIKKIRPLLTK